MLVEIEAGRVGIVITKDLSRLGRNSALTDVYKRQLLSLLAAEKKP